MSIWIGLSLLLVFAVIIWVLSNKIKKAKTEYQEIERELEQSKQKLNKEIAELKKVENDRVNARSKVDNLEQQAKFFNEQLLRHQNTINELVENGTQIARASIDSFAEEYKKNQLEKVSQEANSMREAVSKEKLELLQTLEPLKKEVDDYTKQRAAIIEAQKRELEIKNNRDFHRVQLTQSSIDDIGYISTILDRVHKPEVVAKVVWEVYIQGPTKDMLNRVIGKDKKCGIYRITNIDTSQCYIGQGVDVAKRLTEHIKGTLGIQSIADQRIHHEMANTGLQNWTFELLEECSKDELNQREKFYINHYRSNEFGFNRTSGG